MTIKTYTLLISGAGQLGSRYLQGLSKCRNRLRIYVHDVSLESLLQAEQRWQEFGGLTTQHEVYFSSEIKQSPQYLDLAIISTTAHSRPNVIREITQHSEVSYWILEKVLAQNTDGLEEIQLHVGSESLAWVNTPRRIIPWHQMIKKQLCSKSPLHMSVTGGPWGLACNAIHFLDLLAWWSGESLVKVCTDHLDEHWFQAKRAGNWEIFGTLTATFSGGSAAKLTSGSSNILNYFIELTDDEGSWHIDEVNGTAKYTDGSEVLGRIPYQSEMTTTLVDEILTTGNCQLPTLDDSVAIHQVFIEAMLKHWQNHQNATATFIPIT
jgi:hypothetical protein